MQHHESYLDATWYKNIINHFKEQIKHMSSQLQAVIERVSQALESEAKVTSKRKTMESHRIRSNKSNSQLKTDATCFLFEEDPKTKTKTFS